MEKLRAKWIKELTKAERRISNADFNDTKPLGLAEAYEDVLRDTEAYNEQLSTLIAELTQSYREADEAYHIALQGRQMQDIPHLGDKAQLLGEVLEKIQKLQHMKEVRT